MRQLVDPINAEVEGQIRYVCKSVDSQSDDGYQVLNNEVNVGYVTCFMLEGYWRYLYKSLAPLF